MANFVKHTSCDECGSSDAKAVYDDGSSHCFACQHTVPSKEYIEENQNSKPKVAIRSSAFVAEKVEVKERKVSKALITEEEHNKIKSETGFEGLNYRGISDEVLKFYGCRTKLSVDDEVLERYYPTTIDGKIAGYKVREHPKQFRSVGNVGNECDLYGSFRFPVGGKYVLITEGECLLPNTEVLTPTGWISLENWNGQEIMQANGEFAQPFAKIEKQYTGKMIRYESGSYQLDMTPEHNMLRLDYSRKNVLKVKAGDISKKHLVVPRTVNILPFITETEEIDIRIQVMISADFTFNEEGDLRANFKKQRKIDRCKQLLDAKGVRYVINPLPSREGYFTVFIHRGHNLDVQREFNYEKHLKYAEVIIDEMLFWDGNSVKNRNQTEYSSKYLSNATFIQTCAHITGRVSTVMKRTNKFGEWYKVSILHSKNTSSTQQGFTEYDYDGKVMCLSTPDGTLMVRQNGSISLTGNCDAHAAFQMLKSYTDYKGWPMCAVVSITNGGANPAKQLANNYEFLNQFENIILGLDSDAVGKEAIEKCITALPKGKVKVATWKLKDPNAYLMAGESQKFINDFYNAKTYVPAGVLGSDQLYDRMLNQAKVEKVPFPPLFKELNFLFNGGMSLGYIYNIAADTGIGKTSLVNELIYYWIFNSPHLIGVVSMELSDAQYAEVLYSRHIQRKLALMDDDAKLEFLGHDDSREKGDFLFKREDGSPRFFLCEDRDASLEQLQETIEQMVISSGVKVVVLDPLQDVLDGLSNEEQATFMKWAKSMIKSHGISFVFINHKRKSQANTPGGMDEADIHGSSTIIKSAGANILLARDKMAEDMRVRNTTRIQVSKNRITGLTGPAGAVYYDNETHTMHNYEDFFGEQFVMPQK